MLPVVWDRFCAAQPEANHTWAAIKELLRSRVALTKHCTNMAIQKLCSARQGQDLMVTLFGAYIVTTCEGTDSTNYNKCILIRTKLHLEIRAAIEKAEEYITPDACLNLGVEAKATLATTQNTIRHSSPCQKIGCRRRLDKVRERPATTGWRVALRVMTCSICKVVLATGYMAVVALAPATAANTLKATEAARMSPEQTRVRAIARSAVS